MVWLKVMINNGEQRKTDSIIQFIKLASEENEDESDQRRKHKYVYVCTYLALKYGDV